MREQHEHFVLNDDLAQSEAEGTSIIAVVNGKGFFDIYDSFQNVKIINGGNTMNPSVSDIKKALLQVATPNCIILPNNKNVYLTALKASKLSDININIHIYKTTDIAQGLSALLGFNKDKSLNQNIEMIDKSLKNINTFSVTKAIKDSKIDGTLIKNNQFFSLDKDNLIFSGDDIETVLIETLKKLNVKENSLLTLYSGSDYDDHNINNLKVKISKKFLIEVQSYKTLQPNYHLIVSIE